MAEKTSSSEKIEDDKQTSEYLEHVCDVFSPLRDHWPLIQDVLLWRKLEISVTVFNIFNVVFWLFLTPRLQLVVSLAILLSLLWSTPPVRNWIISNIQSRKQSKPVENVDSDDSNDVLSSGDQGSERKITTYKDFCQSVAVILDFFTKCWIKLKNLKEENAYKFYFVVAMFIVTLAVVYTRLPIGNILYLTVMSLFLWPAIVFYGIKDRVTGKVQKLFLPFFTQWQSSRTKRKRTTLLKDNKHSDISEDEDFTLNTTGTERILTSAVSPQARQQQQHADPQDSVNSSLTFIDGLEFPSMTSMRRDSAESFNSDDFAQGLNFNSIIRGSHHSSMDSLSGENNETLMSENEHTSLGVEYSPQKYQLPQDHEQDMVESRADHRLAATESQEQQELRNRTQEQSLTRNKSLEDFEVIESSELEAEHRDEQQPQPHSSYIKSGKKYVGKLFGYS